MANVNILSAKEWLLVARKFLSEDRNGAIEENNVRVLEVRPAAEKGAFGGFLGDSLPIRVRVKLASGTEKNLALFMKTIPSESPVHADLCLSAFRKEVVLYEKIFPLMKNLSSPEESKSNLWAPRAFLTRPDLLLMEDLMAQGFVERDRRNPFDFSHVALALDCLARFHASSWLLEREESRKAGHPVFFSQLFPEVCQESIFVENPKIKLEHCFAASCKAVMKALPLIYEVKSSPNYETIVKQFPTIVSRMTELVRSSVKNRNVLNHGDLWSNNLLFRYGEDGKSASPTDARLLDFQITRYAPPAVDINSLVFLTTRPDLRRARGGDMLRRYHSSLRDALARAGAHADDFLTWDDLVATCDEYHHVGLIIAPFYHHVSLIDSERLKRYMSPDRIEEFIFDEPPEVMADSLRDDEYYRTKIGEEITELVECALINHVKDFWKRAVEKSS